MGRWNVLVKGQVHMTPKRVGLYNPAFEHDSCGVAMVVDMHGRRSRDIVDKAITALLNLEHRGAQGAEPRSGDGAGILIQVPDAFLREVVDFELPAAGSYATGIAFLPQSSKDAAAACAAVEKIAEAEGLTVLGWRNVPTDDSSLGALSRDAMPTFRQVFMTGASGMTLERRAYVIRKRAEHELGTKGPGQDGPGRETVYFPSLSGQTFIYKGMLTTPQLKAFYLDLQDDRLTSAACGVIQPIKLQVTGSQQQPSLALTAQQSTAAGAQFVQAKGLDHQIVGPAIQAADSRVHLLTCSQHQHGQI